MKQLRIRGVAILYNEATYKILHPDYSNSAFKNQPYDLAEVVMLLKKLGVRHV